MSSVETMVATRRGVEEKRGQPRSRVVGCQCVEDGQPALRLCH